MGIKVRKKTPVPEPKKPAPKIIPAPYAKPLPNQAVVVYQHGVGNVVQVEAISRLAAKRGNVKSILNGTFLDAFRFAQGLLHAGWTVDTMSCESGDVTKMNWTRKLETNPYHDLMAYKIVRSPGIEQ